MTDIRQIQVTFDCENPRVVAQFWKAALGYVDPPVPERFASWDEFEDALPDSEKGEFWACQDPNGVGPRLFFQRVPERKSVKNRLHLDIRIGPGLRGDERLAELESEAVRLEAIGARRLYLMAADGDNESCLVMQDVEGNEFCLD